MGISYWLAKWEKTIQNEDTEDEDDYDISKDNTKNENISDTNTGINILKMYLCVWNVIFSLIIAIHIFDKKSLSNVS